MITYIQAIILGLVQGVSELFPVSSLGHGIIIPSLLRWNIDQSSNSFLVFLVVVHLATALVLIGFFWKEWLAIVKGVLKSIFKPSILASDPGAQLGWRIVVATIPAGLLGLLFQKKLSMLFAAAATVAAVLILNGLLLFVTEYLSKKRRMMDSIQSTNPEDRINQLSYGKVFGIGIMQALALIPGFSRTGSALSGGLLAGMDTEAAARFSFLLATPLILAAAVLKVPDLFTSAGHGVLGQAIVGAIAAAIAAWFSVVYLTRYFKTKTLTPFATYCLIAGVLALLILSF